MYSKAVVIAALLASVEARFGEEGKVQAIISGLGNFGQPGQAATLAGASPGVLLAGANACAKLQLADQIVATLGNDAQVIAAAAALVAAEKNFNPFAVSIPSLCSDAGLPATQQLRGIVPLVDPAVGGANVENANSAASLANPFNAAGLSVADVARANGFSNFTAQGSDGSTAAPAAGNAGNNNGNNNNAGNGNAAATRPAGNGNAAATKPAGNAAATKSAAAGCGAVRTLTTVVVAAPTATRAAGNNNNNGNKNGNKNNNGNQNNGNGNGNQNNGNGNGNNQNNGNGNNNQNNGGGNNNAQKSSIAGLDFGQCVPTIKFVGGLGGRPATEFTFQAIDPKIAANQQEALNPNIITNRICDELTNICAANQAAKDKCQEARAQIQALNTRNAATAEAWNEALGFAGVDVSQR